MHNSYRHLDINSSLVFYPEKLLSKTLWSSYSRILNAVQENPQFALIYPDKTDLSPALIEIDENFGPLPDKKILSELVLDCLTSPLRIYHCRFCEEEYDILPTLKIVREHIKQCTALHS